MVSVPLFGAVWATALFVSCLRVRWFVILLGCSVVFQAGSVINISIADGFHGITPYTACGVWAFFLTVRFLLSDYQAAVKYCSDQAVLWLGAYFVFSAGTALAFPLLFSGVSVFSLMNIAGFDVARVPLVLGLSQFAQIANTAIHCSVIAFLLLALNQGKYRPRHLVAGIFLGVGIVIAIGLYDRVASIAEWPFIGWHFLTNQGYKLAYIVKIGEIYRLSAPFSEPSYSSAYLSAVFCGLITHAAFEKERSKGWLIFSALVVVALVNTLGATGIVAAAVAVVIVLLVASVIATTPDGRWLRRRVLLSWAALLTVSSSLIILISANDWLQTIITDKWSADSTKYRIRSNLYALQLVHETFGLGVGLGGNRASSYFASLISNVGLIGAALFSVAITMICIRCYKGRKLFALGSLLGAVIAVAIAIPDLNIPFFWMFVFAALIQSMPRSAAGDAQAASQRCIDVVGPGIGASR